MSYDPDGVGTAQMLEAINETGFKPSLAQSRIASTSKPAFTGTIPPLIQAALDQAQSEGKRVFVDFHAKWCGACRTMDKTTFADAAVIDALDKGYVFVKVDTDEHPNVGKHFDVVGLPTVVALDQSGDIVYRHTGPLKAAPLLDQLAALNGE